jgi:hypothetical protein
MGKNKKIRNAFLIGVVLYFSLWFLLINFDDSPWDFDCCEASCYYLLFLSFPFSMAFSTTTLSITYGTFVTGSLLCG